MGSKGYKDPLLLTLISSSKKISGELKERYHRSCTLHQYDTRQWRDTQDLLCKDSFRDSDLSSHWGSIVLPFSELEGWDLLSAQCRGIYP
jgi:hypothetical protein